MSDRSKVGTFLFEGGAQKVLGTAGVLLGAAQQLDGMYRAQTGGESPEPNAELLAQLEAERKRTQEAEAAAERQRRTQRLFMYAGAAIVAILLIVLLTKKK